MTAGEEGWQGRLGLGAQATVADLLLARSDDDHPGLRFEDRQWTWREVVAESAARASYLQGLGGLDPPHVGVLLGNVPEYVFWLGATALAGATLVGVNATRRGQALADDVVRTDCRLVLTDAAGAALLEGTDLGPVTGHVIRVDEDDYRTAVAAHADRTAADVVEEARPAASDLFLLLFTSGTTGAPKAVRCTQGRLAGIAVRAASIYGFERADVAYCTMPLFHGNALMVLWGPSLAVGATVALARRFSASGFLPDVRRHGATTFTYVGKALAYVLATPSSPDDADCSLRRGFGTEASVADRAAFERRFGCVLTEGYGSSEGGVSISPTPGTPPGALGRAPEDVMIVDPDTKLECPPAIFDDRGALLNADAAVGEIVSREGADALRGLLQGPRRQRRPDTRQLVLDRRPRLSRRRRLRLLRRAPRGLAAGRLGELHGRPGGAGPRARPRLRRRRRLSGARPAHRRPGDGRRRDAARPRLRPGGLRPLPRGPTRSRDQVGAGLRAGDRSASPDGQRQGHKGCPPATGLVVERRPRLLPGRGGCRRLPPAHRRRPPPPARRVRPPRPRRPHRGMTTPARRTPGPLSGTARPRGRS